MKVLFYYSTPFALAHGGHQVQIEQTKAALEELGVKVEYLRWWDDQQTGDIVHAFCRIPYSLLQLMQSKGIKVVVASLLTEQGSRSRNHLRPQKTISKILTAVLPGSITTYFAWDSFRDADACVALTQHEANLMTYLFNAPTERMHIVPNGVEEVFRKSPPQPRSPWLVCTGTITERKRMLELATGAVAAQTPTWIIGKAYRDDEAYAQQFFKLAKENPQWVRFTGPLGDRHELAAAYRSSRGFVLLSAMESLSLSALEAAACECPLLLSDLPWARTVFGNAVSYCPVTANTETTAAALRKFYDAAPKLSPPPQPLGWPEIGQQLKTIYAGLLKTSR